MTSLQTTNPSSPSSKRLMWTFGAIFLLAILIPLLDHVYYTKLVTRISVFAIAAVSLDLVVGFVGRVSLGHAAFFGIGVYSAGILANLGFTQIWIVIPVAITLAAVIGCFIGAISLRTSGLYFIFITLAFSQMLFSRPKVSECTGVMMALLCQRPPNGFGVLIYLNPGFWLTP